MDIKYKAIRIDNYYVVVDKDAVVVENDWVQQDDRIYKCILPQHLQNKIIATIHKDMRNEGIPLIVIPDETLWDRITKARYRHFEYELSKNKNYILENPQRVRDFDYGFIAAQSKGTYTEEDIRKAIDKAFKIGNERIAFYDNDYSIIIQSLQKKPPKAVMLEMEGSGVYDILPLPSKPFNGMKVIKGGKIGTVKMHTSNHDGSWQWAEIPEFNWWNVPEIKQVVYRQIKIKVNSDLTITPKKILYE